MRKNLIVIELSMQISRLVTWGPASLSFVSMGFCASCELEWKFNYLFYLTFFIVARML